ncbi:MAG: DUF255 domain-containing protein [Bacteroidetes bacterium]|nr:DUF255 domain-containing protein [Bacteroidota bacterium]
MQTSKTPFIRFLFFLLIIPGLSFCQMQEKKMDKIHWMSFQEAVKKSQAQPKKIFIDVYTNWCGWCKRMDATTFEDPAIVAYVNKNYYAVKFNAETHDTIQFMNKSFVFKPEYKSNEFAVQMLNGQMSYPTSVYFDEALNEIGPMPGYLNAEQFIIAIKYFGENIYKSGKSLEDYFKESSKN